MRLNVTEDATVTPGGVTFSPPVATGSVKALDPRGPSDVRSDPTPQEPPATVEDAPLYVVVMQGGVEVLYKRVGD